MRLPTTGDPELPYSLRINPYFATWGDRELTPRERQLYLRNRYRIGPILWAAYDPHAFVVAVNLYLAGKSQRIFK